MATTTTNRALPITALTDVPDEAVSEGNLAMALDAVASIYFGTLANRGAASAAAGTAKGCPGTLYWATDTAQLSLSFGGVWIDLGGASAAPIPVGGSVEYTGNLDPADARWKLEDGRAVSRTTYATLFAVQGTTYGAGDGSTTFNLPDSRGRVTVGPDNMGTAAGAAGRLTANSGRGNSGGEEKHLTTSAESGMDNHTHTGNIPSHTHSGNIPNHTHSGNAPSHTHTGAAPDHTHGPSALGSMGIANRIGAGYANGGNEGPAYGNHIHTIGLTNTGGSDRSLAFTTSGPSATAFTTGNPSATAFTTGGPSATAFTTAVEAGEDAATPHNNMQPFIVKNKIIRVL